MERFAGKVAIVTGASVGIGAVVAKRLVSHKLKVIACARGIDKLQETAKSFKPEEAKLYTAVKCDVTKEEDIKNVFKIAQEKFGGVHVLINNAGIAVGKPILEMSAAEMHTQTDVNVIGLTLCAKEAINQMRANGVDDGHVINVSSLAGQTPTTTAASSFYLATKHAVNALTIGLRLELRALGSKIRISQISPGLVETEFAQRAVNNPEITAIYKQYNVLQGKDIADAIEYSLSRPAYVGIHDITVLAVEENYIQVLELPKK